MMYLLLFAGLFMGWSLGTNDAANAFGTAVATRVIKYRTAITIIAALVIVGAFTGGANNIDKVAELATSNKVAATIGGIAIAVGVLTYSKKVMLTVGSNIASISQLDGFIVIIGMALTVVIMGKWMGILVSTSQAVVGAVIGAGLVKGVDNIHFSILGRIALAWISSPTVAGLLTYLVAVATKNYFLS